MTSIGTLLDSYGSLHRIRSFFDPTFVADQGKVSTESRVFVTPTVNDIHLQSLSNVSTKAF